MTETGETWTQLAQRVAAEFDVVLTEDEADYILWEYTGFPFYWDATGPIACCERQLREYFTNLKSTLQTIKSNG